MADVFTQQILGFTVKAKAAAGNVAKSLALQGLRGVVKRSPVDTGRFKGNWRVGVGEPDLRFNKDLKDKAGSYTVSRGKAVIAKAADSAKIHVTNTTPYGPYLEEGHSSQAPPGGIVAVTINDMRASLNRTASEIKRSNVASFLEGALESGGSGEGSVSGLFGRGAANPSRGGGRGTIFGSRTSKVPGGGGVGGGSAGSVTGDSGQTPNPTPPPENTTPDEGT